MPRISATVHYDPDTVENRLTDGFCWFCLTPRIVQRTITAYLITMAGVSTRRVRWSECATCGRQGPSPIDRGGVMPQAVDYSWARPGGQTIAAAGFVGALRYLGRDVHGRDIGRDELADLHGHGLPVAVIWETTAARSLQGFDAGRDDAHTANAFADGLGWADGRPIYFTTDTDVSGWSSVADYYRGVASVKARPWGVYGEYDVIEGAGQAGVTRWLWQCGAWSLNGQGSGGSIRTGDGSSRRLSRHALLFQHVGYVYPAGQAGGACDANEVFAPDWGQWHPNQPIGDDVTEQDKIDIVNGVVAALRTDDQFLTNVAVKVARTVGGQSKGEGQAWAQDITNLGDVINTTLRTGVAGGADPDAIANATVDELADRLKG